MAAACESDQPLFSFTKRGCICPETISQTFHALVPKLGLPMLNTVSSPRVGSLCICSELTSCHSLIQ